MAIDVTREPPIPLAQVPRLPCVPRQADGKFQHPSMWVRYAKRGLKKGSTRIFLETVKAGSKLCTSEAAIARFYAALSNAQVAQSAISDEARKTEIERRLDEAGL